MLEHPCILRRWVGEVTQPKTALNLHARGEFHPAVASRRVLSRTLVVFHGPGLTSLVTYIHFCVALTGHWRPTLAPASPLLEHVPQPIERDRALPLFVYLHTFVTWCHDASLDCVQPASVSGTGGALKRDIQVLKKAGSSSLLLRCDASLWVQHAGRRVGCVAHV